MSGSLVHEAIRNGAPFVLARSPRPKPMRTTIFIFFFLGLTVGCSNEIPGESRLPRCEPRSNVDPARLNIDTSAEDYAVADPCRAILWFYIAGNTELRAVEGEIDFTHFEGERAGTESFDFEFSAPEAGMFSETVELAPIEGYLCRELLVDFSRLACRDGEGVEIECPEVRVKTSYVFEDFNFEADGLDVCFD